MSEKGSWEDLPERAMSKLSIRVRYNRIPKGFQLFIMGNLTKPKAAKNKNLRTLMNNPSKTTSTQHPPAGPQREKRSP